MATAKQLQHERLFKLLGNKRRLAIIDVLIKHKSAPVGVIADKIELSFHATSKHLQLLEQGGLISHTDDGSFRVYKTNRPKSRLLRAIMRHL